LTFTTLLILSFGRRLALHHEAVTSETADVAPDIDFKQLVRNIVRFTFLFEAVGAVVLFVAWVPRFTLGEAAWHAVFQAVSAFCNAGFSTFSNSLMGFHDAPVTLSVVMTLVVVGGLGFLTLQEFHLQLQRTKRHGAAPALSLHSRLALAVTGILLLGGWIAFTALEWGNTMASMTAGEKLLNGLFMSVTARTAGFNTVDYGAAAESTNFVTILLMSIGGSPGSTAGGLKTTTVAAIGLLALSRLRGLHVTEVRGRTIPDDTIHRAVGLFVVGFLIVTCGILFYAILHLDPPTDAGSSDFLSYMFEAVSAFNTVGLSMGATSTLEYYGKMLTILMMYVGRVGPLTLAAAVSRRRPPVAREFRYAYEDLIIG
jgi:trk system potassium uptake protein TrkH